VEQRQRPRWKNNTNASLDKARENPMGPSVKRMLCPVLPHFNLQKEGIQVDICFVFPAVRRESARRLA